MRRALLLAVALGGCFDPATSRTDAPVIDASRARDAAAADMAGADVDAQPDAGPLDAGPLDAGPLDAGALDAGPLVDAAPPPDPCAAVDDLVALAQPAGAGFVYSDITRDDDGGHATCGGYGADRILHFVAPRAGVWRAHVEADIVGYEPVLHARRVCADPASELACSDQLPATPGAAVQLRLAAGEGVYLFVDADNARGGFFRLRVDPVPEVVDACDPARLVDACPLDQECRAGTCAPRSVPVMESATIWRQGPSRYGMWFAGSDAGADAVAFLLVPVIRGVPEGPPSRLNIRDLAGAARWSRGFRVNTPGSFARAHRLRIAVIDALDQRSAFIEVPINATARAELGEKCDAVRVPCAGRLLCQGDRCVQPDRPTIFAASGVLNPAEPAVRVDATVNRAAQVRRLAIELLDAEGGRIETLTADVTAGLQGTDRLPVQVSRRLDADPPLDAVRARITAIGATGWESSPLEIELAPAAERAEGEACDPGRALDACPADTTCFERACSPIEAECPAGWDPRPLEGDGPWRYRGVIGDDTLATRPSCGGGAHAVAHVFEAPADGAYLITAYSGELSGDPVLAIRSHCGYDGRTHPEFELACNDDALRFNARLVVSLTAGQRIYPIVDGHADWRGRYVLLIDRR